MARKSQRILVNYAQFGRLIGVSRQRISKAAQHGKLGDALIIIGDFKRIDLEKGLVEWKRNVFPSHTKRKRTPLINTESDGLLFQGIDIDNIIIDFNDPYDFDDDPDFFKFLHPDS